MWIESNHDCWRVLFYLTFDAEDWDDDRIETTKQRRKISLEVKVAGEDLRLLIRIHGEMHR